MFQNRPKIVSVNHPVRNNGSWKFLKILLFHGCLTYKIGIIILANVIEFEDIAQSCFHKSHSLQITAEVSKITKSSAQCNLNFIFIELLETAVL